MIWQDPPPRKRGHPGEGRWFSVMTELREQPGRWALVEHKPSQTPPNSTTTQIKKAGGEATIRRNGDGWDIYARWPENEEN